MAERTQDELDESRHEVSRLVEDARWQEDELDALVSTLTHERCERDIHNLTVTQGGLQSNGTGVDGNTHDHLDRLQQGVGDEIFRDVRNEKAWEVEEALGEGLRKLSGLEDTVEVVQQRLELELREATSAATSAAVNTYELELCYAAAERTVCM